MIGHARARGEWHAILGTFKDEGPADDGYRSPGAMMSYPNCLRKLSDFLCPENPTMILV